MMTSSGHPNAKTAIAPAKSRLNQPVDQTPRQARRKGYANEDAPACARELDPNFSV